MLRPKGDTLLNGVLKGAGLVVWISVPETLNYLRR